MIVIVQFIGNAKRYNLKFGLKRTYLRESMNDLFINER